MRKMMLFSLSLLVIFTVWANPPEVQDEPNPLKKTFKTWNDTIPLTWNDFQGKPLVNAPEVAIVSSQVEYSLFIKDSKADTGYVWTVQSKFFPKLSWSKKDKQNDYILKHEQMHFAITELYARLLRKRLSELTGKNKNKANIKSIAREIMNMWILEQNTYDMETNHSINVDKQLEWNQNIMQRINELKPYSAK